MLTQLAVLLSQPIQNVAWAPEWDMSNPSFLICVPLWATQWTLRPPCSGSFRFLYPSMQCVHGVCTTFLLVTHLSDHPLWQYSTVFKPSLLTSTKVMMSAIQNVEKSFEDLPLHENRVQNAPYFHISVASLQTYPPIYLSLIYIPIF